VVVEDVLTSPLKDGHDHPVKFRSSSSQKDEDRARKCTEFNPIDSSDSADDVAVGNASSDMEQLTFVTERSSFLAMRLLTECIALNQCRNTNRPCFAASVFDSWSSDTFNFNNTSATASGYNRRANVHYNAAYVRFIQSLYKHSQAEIL
jgi:hypothetical protein